MKIYKIFTFIVALGVITSCDDFDDTNVDPNVPSTAPTSTLLTSAQLSISDAVAATTPELYVQHLAETQYTEDSRYQTSQFDFNGWYTGPLANLNEIIELNSGDQAPSFTAYGSNANQIAVARILKAYFFQFMTDRWGALPYNEALQGAADFSPSYNSQEEIYNALFTELEEAVAQMDNGAGVAGDIILNGDMDRWARFANTLRMVMAMRISEVNPSLAESQFEDALADGIIESNVTYDYLADQNNENPWFTRFRSRTDYAVSNTLVDFLLETDDPRISAYAETNAVGNYVGMPYGIANAEAGEIPNNEVSFITDDIIATQDAPLYVFTIAQTQFYMAEAALNGWTTPMSAQEHYEAGIEASMEQWDVYSPTALSDYLAQPEVAWDESNAIELIGEQKWVAYFMMGYEAWAEWRRLGYPELEPAVAAMNNSGLIPVRHAYPTSERDLNQENYNAAVSMQGEDVLDTHLWWDVE